MPDGTTEFLGRFLRGATAPIGVPIAMLTEKLSLAPAPSTLLAPRDEMSIRRHASDLGVKPIVAVAVGEQETRGRGAGAVSPAGARGLLQVMPTTSKALKPRYGSDLTRQGVGYLRDLEERFSDVPGAERLKFVLAAYNGGPTRLRRAQSQARKAGLNPDLFEDVMGYLPKETRDYVPGVLNRMKGRR